ncbi:MAG: hypothetical protein M1833_001286 [Piccolia ochrophora]|nr:MAG: hypothetical protein M1833_001286 [Piccolia ochrophora]
MGFCLVWNVANSLVLRLQSRPIHPGINVGIELCNWIGLVVTVSMLASLGTAFDTWSDSSVPQYRFNEIGTRVVALERSGITFGLALIILHFALFVYACRETEKINQRNRQARLTSAVQKATEDMRKHSPSPSKTKFGNGILCERCHCDVRDRRVSAHDLESSFGITPIEQPPDYVTDHSSENQDAGDRNSTLQAKRKTGRKLTLATAVSERDVSPVSPE